MTIIQSNNQDNTLMEGVQQVTSTPILCLNVWEHAYFEQHDGEKNGTYLTSFWDALDWKKISENFEEYNMQKKVAPII